MKSPDFLTEGIAEDAHEMHLDHEVQMARQELYHSAEDAIALHKLLRHVSEQQGLEGWVSSKITLAADYLKTVREHLEYQMMNGGAPAEGMTAMVGDAMPVAEDTEANFKSRQMFDKHDRDVEGLGIIGQGEHWAGIRRNQQRRLDKDKEEKKTKQQGVAEVSDATLTSYLTKVDADSRKHKMDPTKRPDKKASKSVTGFAKAFNKLDSRKEQGLAEGPGHPAPGQATPPAPERKKSRDYQFTAAARKARNAQDRKGVTEEHSDSWLNAIEDLRTSKPGMDINTFLDELYFYLDAEYGKDAADQVANASEATHREWYANYTSVSEGTGAIEAYGVYGVKSKPWRKTFKSQAAFEAWLDKHEGNVEVHGTRSLEQGVAEDAVDDFVARGGEVQQGKYHKPRKSEKTEYGSRHIGGVRDATAGKAGKTLGRAASTNFKGGGKAVVSVEEQVNEMSTGSVATVVNPTAKNKAKVGSLFGGTYKQSKPKAK